MALEIDGRTELLTGKPYSDFRKCNLLLNYSSKRLPFNYSLISYEANSMNLQLDVNSRIASIATSTLPDATISSTNCGCYSLAIHCKLQVEELRNHEELYATNASNFLSSEAFNMAC